MDLLLAFIGLRSKDNSCGTSETDELSSRMENGLNSKEKKHQDEFVEYM